MTLQRQMGFWLAALAVFIFFLWAFQDILLPFIAGFVLAYFLDPVADWLERRGLNRTLATLIIIVAAVLVVVVVILLVVPILGDQALKLAQDLPALLKTLLAKFDAAARSSSRISLPRAAPTSRARWVTSPARQLGGSPHSSPRCGRAAWPS